jgi:hypothetical protein
MRRCSRIDGISVVKDCLTTRSRVIANRTVKDSLTQVEFKQPAVTEESPVAQLRAIQRCEAFGYAIGKTGSATP